MTHEGNLLSSDLHKLKASDLQSGFWLFTVNIWGERRNGDKEQAWARSVKISINRASSLARKQASLVIDDNDESLKQKNGLIRCAKLEPMNQAK